MRIPPWGHAILWLLFGAIVYLPVLRLAWEFSALYDERAAALLSLPLLAVAVGAGVLLAATMGGRSYLSLGGGAGGAIRWQLGPWRAPAFALCMVPIILAVGVPLLTLVVSAGPWETYAKALRGAGGQIGVSLGLAALAAAVMSLSAVLLASSLERARGVGRTLLHALTQIPFAIPAVVLGIGMVRLWNIPATAWLYETRSIIVLGYVAHFIPFAIRAVYANLQQLNPCLLEAARLAGASEPRVVLRIALPLLRSGLIGAFFIGFVLSLGELGVTLLVTPPGTATIPITIYNYMHYGAEATVSALCLMLVAFGMVLAGALLMLDRRFSRLGP